MARNPHVILLPCPAQGHINPAIQFSKLLVSKGLKVTLVISTQIELTVSQLSSIQVVLLSSSNPEEDEEEEDDDEKEAYRKRVKKQLPGVVSGLREEGERVACLIYDSIMPWSLGIARKLKMGGAAFFTQSCAVDAIFCSHHEGRLEIPVGQDRDICVEGVGEMLELHDLPSFFYEPETLLAFYNVTSYLQSLVWFVLYITNVKALEYMESRFKFKAVGPTIPSIYLSAGNTQTEDYGMSMFKTKPEEAHYIIDWLDSKEVGSVVYVSFGSLAMLSLKQTEEILEVLAHKSTGCFVTHCGWNSTMEGLSLGVPMVGMPQMGDQMTNAKFICDVWKVGVRVKRDEEEKVVKRGEIWWCINEVMDHHNREGIIGNVEKWKNLAWAAAAHGGTSDNNIHDFVAQLISDNFD
ncbi:UDP-glycosyltransferase 74E1 [Linum perenne]